MRNEELSHRRVLKIVSDFLEGKRGIIEPITVESGVNGIQKIYITPVGVWHGRGISVVKEEDAPTLLPPTVAHTRVTIGDAEERGRKLAIQMWMGEPTAEEYLLEVAKVKNAWKHLVKKRMEKME